MARRNIIEILLTSKDQATPNIKLLGLSLTDLKSGIDLVAGGARKMARAVEAAFDFTEQGAAILQTRDSFDRLGVSIEAMRQVSLGTVDDMTLMTSTLTLTAGASAELQAQLLQNAPQLLEIAKAANALNPALGDTAFQYQSIATGIKRSSPLILDNLGLIVKIGAANEIYAAQLGKTVEMLSAEEKQIALLNATILAGQRMIEQAGGSVESYTDAWARLRVEIKNSTDAMKAQAAEGVQPLLTGVADLLVMLREYSDEVNVLRSNLGGMGDALGLAIQQQEDLDIQLGRSATTARYAGLAYRDSQERMIAISDRYAGLADYYASRQGRITDAAVNSAEAWDQYSWAIEDAQRRNDEYTAKQIREELAAIEEAAARATERVEGIKWSTAQTLTEQLESGKEQIAGLRDRAGELIEKIGELEGMSYRTPAQDTQLSELRGQLGGVRSDIDNVIEGMREMSARFVLGLIEMKIAVDGKITEAEQVFMASYARQMGLVDDLAVRQAAVISDVVDNINSGTMDAAEAMVVMGDATNDLVDDFAGLGDSAGRSLDDVAGSIGDVRSQLLGIPSDVAAAQGAIDGMKGKDIEVRIKFKVDRFPTLGKGVTQRQALLEMEGLSQATGGDFIVNRPTPFIAGDAGPERAIFIPQGQPGFNGPVGGAGAGGTRIEKLEINVYGTADAHETARLVVADMQGRGLIPQHLMR